MNKKELINLLWDERKINILNPSKLKITQKGPRLIEVYYNGKFEVDDIDRFQHSEGPKLLKPLHLK